MDILSIILLISIAILTAVFILYRKIIFVTQSLIIVTFLLGILGVVSSIFLPNIYITFTDKVFENNFLSNQLQNLDLTLTSVGSVSDDVLGSIKNLLGSEDDNIKFESRLYPSFIQFLSDFFRLFIIVLSFIFIILSIYLRYSFAGISEYNKVKKRIKNIEKKLENDRL